MRGIKGITTLQKNAILREYANAVRLGNKALAKKIRNANGKWVTAAEFAKATV